jgi:hypothetical protein
MNAKKNDIVILHSNLAIGSSSFIFIEQEIQSDKNNTMQIQTFNTDRNVSCHSTHKWKEFSVFAPL